MAASQADRLEMIEACRTTFGAHVTATILEEWEARDQQIITLIDDVKSLNARFDTVDARFKSVDDRFKSVDTRFDAVFTRFDTITETLHSIEQMQRVVVMGFIGLATAAVLALVQLI